jgi:hypothetical protein
MALISQQGSEFPCAIVLAYDGQFKRVFNPAHMTFA